MRDINQLKALVTANREQLISEAETILTRLRKTMKRDDVNITYFLVDQDYIDDLLEKVLHLTDDEMMEIAENDINSAGEIDIWLDAAKNLGFKDFIEQIEELKKEGP